MTWDSKTDAEINTACAELCGYAIHGTYHGEMWIKKPGRTGLYSWNPAHNRDHAAEVFQAKAARAWGAAHSAVGAWLEHIRRFWPICLSSPRNGVYTLLNVLIPLHICGRVAPTQPPHECAHCDAVRYWENNK